MRTAQHGANTPMEGGRIQLVRALSPEEIRHSQLVVCAQARSKEEARQLLDMLDLLRPAEVG